MTPPTVAELRRLLHEIRDPLGSVVLRLAVLDNAEVSAEVRQHLDALAASSERMIEAVAQMTERLGLDRRSSTPLAILSRSQRVDADATACTHVSRESARSDRR